MTMFALRDGRHEARDRAEALEKQHRGPASLRTWLAGRWLILFSHPDDFAQEQLEMDRWVAILSRSFCARGVVPAALARAGSDPAQGWLGRLATLDRGTAAVLALDAPAGTLADLSAAVLRARIARSGPRFAMVVDPSLRCRRTLSYRLPDELPSPLELIGWAVALRKRAHAEESRADDVGSEHWWAAGRRMTAKSNEGEVQSPPHIRPSGAH